MLSNERRSLIPCSHLELDISSFVMCGVFAKLVWQFLIQQHWVPDPLVGISVLELYAAFVQSTGWIVPINISSYKQEERPPEFRSTMLASRVWAHETQWTLLKHARQPLTVQVVTFRRILSAKKKCSRQNMGHLSKPIFESTGGLATLGFSCLETFLYT